MPLRSTLLGLTFLTALISPIACLAQTQYSFSNFDGKVAEGATISSTYINGISNTGVVVGSTLDTNGSAFNFTGVPGSFSPLNLDSAAAPNGINSSRQVVGAIDTSAFLLESGIAGSSRQILPSVTSATTVEAAFGINDSGSIVGNYVDDSAGLTLGFLDVNGAFLTLQPVDASVDVTASGINNAGLVVGFYAQADSVQHGFLYDSVTKSYTLPADPNTVLTANGNLASTQFFGINDSGLAVGSYLTTDTGSQFGFLYDTKTSTYTYLDNPSALPDASGIRTTVITGISNSGEIAGYFFTAAGVQRGFTAVPVPEAASSLGLGLLLTLGGGAVALRVRRHRVN